MHVQNHALVLENIINIRHYKDVLKIKKGVYLLNGVDRDLLNGKYI